jgi:hypothetical protein
MSKLLENKNLGAAAAELVKEMVGRLELEGWNNDFRSRIGEDLRKELKAEIFPFEGASGLIFPLRGFGILAAQGTITGSGEDLKLQVYLRTANSFALRSDLSQPIASYPLIDRLDLATEVADTVKCWERQAAAFDLILTTAERDLPILKTRLSLMGFAQEWMEDIVLEFYCWEVSGATYYVEKENLTTRMLGGQFIELPTLMGTIVLVRPDAARITCLQAATTKDLRRISKILVKEEKIYLSGFIEVAVPGYPPQYLRCPEREHVAILYSFDRPINRIAQLVCLAARE